MHKIPARGCRTKCGVWSIGVDALHIPAGFEGARAGGGTRSLSSDYGLCLYACLSASNVTYIYLFLM